VNDSSSSEEGQGVTVSAHVSPWLAQRLQELAVQGERSLSRQIRIALRDHVAQHLAEADQGGR
jgi:predicted transcriptional regulator